MQDRLKPWRRATRRMLVIVTASVAAALVGTLVAPSAPAQEEPAIAVIRDYQQTIIEAMQNADELGYEGRYERLDPAIVRAYDLDFIARRALGSRRWEQLSEAQREQYVEAFIRFTIAIHASRFSDYTGEDFRRLGVQELPRGYVLVKSELVKSNGDTIPINYQMTERDGQWQIVDVFLRGTISEVATRRSEFTAVMERDGFEGLLSSLRERVERAQAQ